MSGCGAEDSTLNIEKKCGDAYSITLTYDSTEREVLMYIPTVLCDQDKFSDHVNNKLDNKDNLFDPSTHILTLPMLISIHCLGCSANMEMEKWKSFAEEFTFIVIAPQGIKRSWNADACCGQAKEEDVDDIGFIQTVVNGAQTSFPTIFPYATVSNNDYDGYVWMTGFSNGGFMTDKIAKFSLFSLSADKAMDTGKHKKHNLKYPSYSGLAIERESI